jgi:hypothetical protein
MKKFILFSVLMVSFSFVQAQTVVKMTLPPQADEPLQIVVLFDEEVPEGIPVVLGLIGYKVTGGIEPYTYEWIQNGNVIGTGNIVVITPAKGDRFELEATDKNKCHSTTSFSMKVIRKANGQNQPIPGLRIYPTLVKDNIIHIDLPESDSPLNANIRIFNVKGVLMFQIFSDESYTVNHYLPDGIYFVSVATDEFHKVVKIIVQH